MKSVVSPPKAVEMTWKSRASLEVIVVYGDAATAFGAQNRQISHFYIQEVFGHRPPRNTSPSTNRRTEEAVGGIKSLEGSPGLLRSRLTPSMPQNIVARIKR